MKRLISAVALAMLIFGSLSAQGNELVTRGIRYELHSDLSPIEADRLINELDSRFEVYNRLFRFDPGTLTSPLTLRAFTNKSAYDAYVSSRLGMRRDGAVYLHYAAPERCELIIHYGSSAAERLMPHQAFIQFFRAFIPNPPSWMREGFAIYFSTLDYANGQLQYEENLAWLDTVKDWGPDAPSLESLLLSDLGESIPSMRFQPASWALISFILNSSNDEYRRSLFESFMLLSPDASARENSLAVIRRYENWTDLEDFKSDYRNYLASRKTYAELLEEGREAYANKDRIRAEHIFMEALDMKPSHYAAYYYLGLLAYEQKAYDMAENHYRSALQNGADQALVYYALGLNAGAAGRNADARSYLQRASRENPERYRARVEELLPRFN